MNMSSFSQIAIVTCVLLAASRTLLAQDAVARQVTEADMPRIPHTEADNALATFRLAKGFSLELVAAEPHVGDPVDACFDEFGRMFVAEMHGFRSAGSVFAGIMMVLLVLAVVLSMLLAASLWNTKIRD